MFLTHLMRRSGNYVLWILCLSLAGCAHREVASTPKPAETIVFPGAEPPASAAEQRAAKKEAALAKKRNAVWDFVQWVQQVENEKHLYMQRSLDEYWEFRRQLKYLADQQRAEMSNNQGQISDARRAENERFYAQAMERQAQRKDEGARIRDAFVAQKPPEDCERLYGEYHFHLNEAVGVYGVGGHPHRQRQSDPNQRGDLVEMELVAGAGENGRPNARLSAMNSDTALKELCEKYQFPKEFTIESKFTP